MVPTHKPRSKQQWPHLTQITPFHPLVVILLYTATRVRCLLLVLLLTIMQLVKRLLRMQRLHLFHLILLIKFLLLQELQQLLQLLFLQWLELMQHSIVFGLLLPLHHLISKLLVGAAAGID